MNGITNLKVTQLLGYFAASQTTRKSDVIDMAGFEGCMFVFEFGTILDTGTIACSINGNDTNATGGTALDGGASVTLTSVEAAFTHSAIVVDIYQPEPADYRYLEAMITLGVANTLITGITAIQYGGKYKPEVTSQLVASSFSATPDAA